jgi:DNA-directed RNA polymerase subunit RPC12/RpoP
MNTEIDTEEQKLPCNVCGYEDYGHLEYNGEVLCSSCYHDEYCYICDECRNYFLSDDEKACIIIDESISKQFDIKQGLYQVLEHPFCSMFMFGGLVSLDEKKLKFIGTPKVTIEIKEQGYVCSDCVKKIEFKQKPITINQ